MSRAELFFWIFLPYVSIAIFVVGHVWRWRHDQFGWTSRSSQLYERRLLAWGSNLFHYGALLAIGGHVIGILVPKSVTQAMGISEHGYHIISVAGGEIALGLVLIGLVILVVRRVIVPRVRAATSRMDVLVFFLLTAIIGLGIWETTFFNWLGGGYDYRDSVAIWFRGIFLFDPHPAVMAAAPAVYQAHAIAAWFLFAVWPFTRLVHAWSYPILYLVRPYVVYRRSPAAGR